MKALNKILSRWVSCGRGRDIPGVESRNLCRNGRALERGFSRECAAAPARTSARY